VDYGFRLPSAFDNRPLKFAEFEEKINQVIYVSATPADYELDKCHGVITEQIIRPTGLLDPQVEMHPLATQVDDLMEEIRQRITKNQRVLVTTLTKRMAEDLAQYLKTANIKARYLHSEVKTIERSQIIRDLRLGKFDVLIGVNLLREGLDLPEVSLVAILDADKTGFLRSTRSLIQTAGRAARNVDGKVILYADVVTDAIRWVIDETARRRKKQLTYNENNNIVPQSIQKNIDEIMTSTSLAAGYQGKAEKEEKVDFKEYLDLDSREKIVTLLRKEMLAAAQELDFEKAAELRDRIYELESI
jgi:excinuclease ABC subunit B